MEVSPAPCTCSNRQNCAGKSRKRLRVLCLHGFRTSAAVLREQLAKWDSPMVNDLLELNFLDAPFPCRGKSDVDGKFPPPFYEWFQYNVAYTEYVGMDECIQYITKYMYEHGPFDGLLGFSQGAVLSAALAGLQQKGLALSEHPSLRFVIIISGVMLENPQMKENCYSENIRCPSVHLIGSRDWLKPRNEQLLQVFQDPVIIRHGARHTVPKLDDEAIAIFYNFLIKFDSGEHHTSTTYAHGCENEGISKEDCLAEIEVLT
ncbi:hypothetical protein KP509_10G038500 [Ceratopteris richardii]|uniref:Serine hydrolase domain-containing protein n=1 Tax=Ceratopteris richardii TaxID=49495 RepID=A0A8T2TYE8_CERRI|nr:hypothetical protein KP509_10G038500 [Ceratopteris richardii]